MSKNLQEIMTGYNPHKQQLEQTRQLVDKWKPSGLLEGLNGENEVHGMSVLLENQARQLIDEANATSTGPQSEEWSGVALPLVRRIFGEIAAKDFVSVQPMNLPSGLVFFLEFKYGSSVAGFGNAKDSNIMGVTKDKDKDADGGLYGTAKYGYTQNFKTANLAASAVTKAAGDTLTEGGKEFNYESSGSTTLHKYVVNLPADADETCLSGKLTFKGSVPEKLPNKVSKPF